MPFRSRRASLAWRACCPAAAALAQRKQLKEALKAFKRASKNAQVDVHTYTNMINVHVRCSDVAAAVELLGAMPTAGFTPNVVTYVELRAEWS